MPRRNSGKEQQNKVPRGRKPSIRTELGGQEEQRWLEEQQCPAGIRAEGEP